MRCSRLMILPAILLVTACAKTVSVPEVPLDEFPLSKAMPLPSPKPPVKIITKPEPLPLPGQLKPLPSNSKERTTIDKPPKTRIANAQASAKVEPTNDGFINAIQVYPFAKGALYQLYAAVSQVTDIALQPGERLVSVSAGDTVRWIVGDTTSGEGKTAQVHILVKPTGKDLTTNLVINTDKRTYHLEMHATKETYMAAVSWTYPHADLIALSPKVDETAWRTRVIDDVNVAPHRLRFRYRISGTAPWKPTLVFDDGAKVYIRFPTGLAQGEAPPLFVIGENGKPALVNYRVKATTYIVDRLFAAAELRHGTAAQRVVRIIRSDARWREKRS